MSSKKGKKGDSRFGKFQTDPKFRNVPQKAKKVAIDERFQGMFKEDKFLNKVSVDQRGKKSKSCSSKDQYKRYYSLEKPDQDSSESDSVDSSAEEEIDEATKEKLRDLSVDYARGEGKPILSDSSSEEEDSSDDEPLQKEDDNEEADEDFDKWGELDHDAESTEEVSRRLAVCNMDWDRVEAEDIFLALASFCPKGGRVEKVTVLTSEFGKKRLKEEDLLGPEELRAKDVGEMADEESSDEEGPSKTDEQINTKAMERVRRYQVNRLKYYYAVAEFDSEETANKVYEECDGTEYELSATRFDLRFIPDEMEFENEEPKSVCDIMPDPDKYKPKLFCTTALQQGKVELTWDETDPDRMKAMRRAFEEDDEDDDVKAYLASESEEDEEKGEDQSEQNGEENPKNDKNAIEVYKALLADINNTEKKEKEEKGNMEITFTPNDTIKETMAKKEVAHMTPWEQYLHKKKEKANAKREKRKKAEAEAQDKEDSDDDNDQDTDGKAFSDDEIPDDLDFEDPFFQGENGGKDKKKNKKKEKKKKSKAEESDEKNGGDLSLLVMDSDEDRGHFDYKDIVAKETVTSKKKKKKLAKELAKKQHDDFELDLKDDRFHAVFDQADFNVDPSHPSFKKTKSMQKIINEKQKRFLDEDNPDLPSSKKKKTDPSSSNSDKKDFNQLDHLVKAVKSKTKLQQKNADAAKKKKKGKR